jgi:hypothetical protein
LQFQRFLSGVNSIPYFKLQFQRFLSGVEGP